MLIRDLLEDKPDHVQINDFVFTKNDKCYEISHKNIIIGYIIRGRLCLVQMGELIFYEFCNIFEITPFSYLVDEEEIPLYMNPKSKLFSRGSYLHAYVGGTPRISDRDILNHENTCYVINIYTGFIFHEYYVIKSEIIAFRFILYAGYKYSKTKKVEIMEHIIGNNKPSCIISIDDKCYKIGNIIKGKFIYKKYTDDWELVVGHYYLSQYNNRKLTKKALMK